MRNGWETKALGDLFQTVTGNTPSKSNASYFGEFVPLVKPPELRDGEVSSSADGLSEEGSQVARIAPPSSVLVSCIGNLGKVGLNTVPVAFNQQINAIIPDHTKALPSFLFYQVLSCRFRDQLKGLASGTTVSIVNKSRFNSIEIVLPPLPEQQRIVYILDESFAAIAAAKANAEKNVQNARELFESHLQAVFSKRGKGWVEKSLGQLSNINYGYTESASSEKVGPHFLRITDIQDNRVDWETVPYCRIPQADLPRYKLGDGDIVFARTGATTGKSYLVSNPPNAVFASYLIRVQLTAKELSPRFLNIFFQTRLYWTAIHAGVAGSAQGGFNATKLGQLSISYPSSAKEQESLVTSLDGLAAETQRLASIYERKLAALDELKKSLLHEAFTGRL